MRRALGEIGGEIGHHQHPVRLGHLPGKLVILLDRLELVAQIDLDDVFHVVGQGGQPLVDVAAVGPDAAGHHLLVVIGQVHEGGEVFAQPHRIEDDEADFAGRHRRQHPQHDRLDGPHGLGAAFAGGFQQQQRAARERQQQGQAEVALRRPQPRVFGQAALEVRQLHGAVSEADGRRDFGRRRPMLPVLGVPPAEQAVAAAADPLHRRLESLEAAPPAVGHLGPLLLALPPAGLDRLVALAAKRLRGGGIAAFQVGDQAGILGIRLGQHLVALGHQGGQPRRVGFLRLVDFLPLGKRDVGDDGGEALFGLLDLGVVPRGDGGIEPPAVLLGRFQDGRPVRPRLQERPPQRQIGADGEPPGDAVQPEQQDEEDGEGGAAADGHPGPLPLEQVAGRIDEQAPQRHEQGHHRPQPVEKSRRFLGSQHAVLFAGKFQGLDEPLGGVTLQERAAEGRIGKLPPLPAPPQQLRRLPAGGLQLLPARVQFLLDVVQLEAGTPLGRLGNRRRLPVGFLPLVLGLALGGVEAGCRVLADLIVLGRGGAVLCLELLHGLATDRGVLALGRGAIGLIALRELALGGFAILLGRLIPGLNAGGDVALGRHALGDQVAQLREELPRFVC